MPALDTTELEILVAAILASAHIGTRDSSTFKGCVERYRRILGELRATGGVDPVHRGATEPQEVRISPAP